jgi:signal transduction histidine kinase
VLGDKDLLTSALANLVDNALKYSGSGSTVQVRANQGRDTVSMEVRDDGPGIPPSERARVVDRFYRLDQSRSLPGNGLGLSIVAATASLHCGKLDLADASPGLVARIVLPRAEGAAAPSGNAPQVQRMEAGA